jgi:hypothetical protein
MAAVVRRTISNCKAASKRRPSFRRAASSPSQAVVGWRPAQVFKQTKLVLAATLVLGSASLAFAGDHNLASLLETSGRIIGPQVAAPADAYDADCPSQIRRPHARNLWV